MQRLAHALCSWSPVRGSPVHLPPPSRCRYVFTAIYSVEMIGKIIGLGFYQQECAYLREPWNWLDFVVVVLG